MAGSVKSIMDYTGTGADLIDVECHMTNGLPTVLIIGHASKAVDEAKDRVRAGFANSNLQFPKKRITINLAPADLPKDATSLDLAMATAILKASKQIEDKHLQDYIFLGELSLEGTLQPVRGLIGRLLAAKALGYHNFYLPHASLPQARLVPDINIKAALSLRDVYLDLSNTLPLRALATGDGQAVKSASPEAAIDLSEIVGQPIAKRALEIAAAGHHNLLLHGPPGTGKTMLARAMCGILPPLDHSEMLEVTHLHSLSGGGFNDIILARPFRSPHHTASTIAIIGGGSRPKPGEASLAHRGVLFLDELPEFSRSGLEALRQPLEDGTITISRVKDSSTYPADFILVATQNPCPCGYWGTSKVCSCTAADIARYQKKVSGPILDRIDLHLAVHGVDHSRLLERKKTADESQVVRSRVEKAYAAQKRRFGTSRFNNSMTNKEIRELAGLSEEAKNLLDTAGSKLGLSARAYVRSAKIARTIADLAQAEYITAQHISEALQYRQPAPNL